MSKLYAIEVKKANLELITFLNGGMKPKIQKKKTWFLFELDESGKHTMIPEIISDRDIMRSYEPYKHGPFMIRLRDQKP